MILAYAKTIYGLQNGNKVSYDDLKNHIDQNAFRQTTFLSSNLTTHFGKK